ncbi:MAG: lyase family protein, partial [Oscillospiraceae bacterium]
MALWAGRFKKEIDKRTNDFNSSVRFDARMYKDDITGSIVHSEMLAKQGIISAEDKTLIHKGLLDILEEIENGTLAIDPNAEDIHMFIEAELTNRIGDAGKRLHTARSRNDQVALDIRMYLRHEIDEIIGLATQFAQVLCTKAEENLDTVMPGYTH